MPRGVEGVSKALRASLVRWQPTRGSEATHARASQERREPQSCNAAAICTGDLAQLVVEGLELFGTAAAPGKVSCNRAHLVHTRGAVAHVEVGKLLLQLGGVRRAGFGGSRHGGGARWGARRALGTAGASLALLRRARCAQHGALPLARLERRRLRLQRPVRRRDAGRRVQRSRARRTTRIRYHPSRQRPRLRPCEYHGSTEERESQIWDTN